MPLVALDDMTAHCWLAVPRPPAACTAGETSTAEVSATRMPFEESVPPVEKRAPTIALFTAYCSVAVAVV